MTTQTCLVFAPENAASGWQAYTSVEVTARQSAPSLSEGENDESGEAASIIFSGTKIYQAVVNSRSALFSPPRAAGVPTIRDFVCEGCQERKQLRLLEEKRREEEMAEEALTEVVLADAKPCPGCKMLTTHLGGCSHVICASCKCHWCWQCAVYKSDNGPDVYSHKSTVHRCYGWQDDYD